MTRKQIEDNVPPCSGITLQVGNYWYSLACLNAFRRNVATTGPKITQFDKIQADQSRCRCCQSQYDTLGTRLRCTLDPQAALAEKAKMLITNREWSYKVSQEVSFSAVLRILDNGGFIHNKTQTDVKLIRTPLSKDDQKLYLTRILDRSHYGLRTGGRGVFVLVLGLGTTPHGF